MQNDNDDDLLMIDSAVIVDSCHVIRSMLTSIIVYMHSVLGSPSFFGRCLPHFYPEAFSVETFQEHP